MTAAGTPGSSYRGERLALDVVALATGEARAFAPPPRQEGVLVLLQGNAELNGEPLKRSSVFEQRASAAYVPPDAVLDVVATSDAEVAWITTAGYELEPGGGVTLVRPPDVTVQQRGRRGWQRDVHDVVDARVPARRLLVGETFNAAGQWSSFPPHKHDGRDGEPALEEAYYFRFDRPGGFGFQGLYDEGAEERAVFLRHGSIVGIPHGYHPVCAAPGYRLYYLWALAGERRELTMFEDPAHRWLSAPID